MLFDGDDALIKKLTGMIFVLFFLLVVLTIAFGLVTFLPNTKHDFSCTYGYHPVLTNRFFQIEEPLVPRSCHG